MKKLLLFLGIAVAAIGCTKSEIEESASPTSGEISFSAGVTSPTISGASTRVGYGDRDCMWADSGDEIGIFTNQTGEENLKFSVDWRGAMTSESKLYTLSGDATRDYYAYHPYMEDDAEGFDKEYRTILINHTKNAPNTPLLWASVSNSNDANVEFEKEHMFKHQLARVDFNFTAGGADITDLSDITAIILKGANAKAAFSIESGEFIYTQQGNIPFKIEDVKNGKIITYLIPTETVKGNVTLEIRANGKTFTTPINTASWVGNKKYKYNVTVGAVPPPTPVDYSDIATVDALLGLGYDDGTLRLSNCYMVDPAMESAYIIPVGSRINTYWGDAEYGNTPSLTIETENWISDNTYTIEPLWNDFNLADDDYDGQITFSKVTGADDPCAIKIEFAESFDYEGNMVVAVKKGGTIVWSWHIWITDYNPYTKENGTTYDIDSYTEGSMLTWMDRNIGARSTDYSASEGNLYYQWGRKDPLRAITDDSDVVDAASTIADAVKAPEYFYKGPSSTDFDWCGSYTDWDQCRAYHWRDAKLPSIKDNEVKYGTTKSIYDPSPLGFMVPVSNSPTKCSSPFEIMYFSNGWNTGDTNKGRTFNSNTTSIFFPASGFRNSSDGGLYYVGSKGFSWSALPNSSGSSYSFYFNNTSVIPSNVNNCAYGYPVRPIKEFPLHD